MIRDKILISGSKSSSLGGSDTDEKEALITRQKQAKLRCICNPLGFIVLYCCLFSPPNLSPRYSIINNSGRCRLPKTFRSASFVYHIKKVEEINCLRRFREHILVYYADNDKYEAKAMLNMMDKMAADNVDQIITENEITFAVSALSPWRNDGSLEESQDPNDERLFLASYSGNKGKDWPTHIAAVPEWSISNREASNYTERIEAFASKVNALRQEIRHEKHVVRTDQELEDFLSASIIDNVEAVFVITPYRKTRKALMELVNWKDLEDHVVRNYKKGNVRIAKNVQCWKPKDYWTESSRRLGCKGWDRDPGHPGADFDLYYYQRKDEEWDRHQLGWGSWSARHLDQFLHGKGIFGSVKDKLDSVLSTDFVTT